MACSQNLKPPCDQSMLRTSMALSNSSAFIAAGLVTSAWLLLLPLPAYKGKARHLASHMPVCLLHDLRQHVKCCI